ncbi:MAG: hypothetical protein IKP47_07830 [Ruminococcus sp.]|nr:hypothetical protein [Ruminococcus sp.]
MSDILKMFVPMLLCAVTCVLLGLTAIPLLRARMTGRFEPRIGSRFKTDGSEPVMGGAVLVLAFALWYFPLSLTGDISRSSNIQDSRAGLILAGIYVIAVTAVGIAEDRLRHFLARPAGVSKLFKQLLIYTLSLSLTLGLTAFSSSSTEVLLPFHLGYIEFGVLYYPLTALVMTLAVNLSKLLFCFGGDTSGSVGGLSELTGAVSLLSVSVCCRIVYSYAGQIFADCAAAACIGMLFWTLAPSKLITGESGSLCIGAMLSAAVLLTKLEFLFLLTSVPQIIDLAGGAFCFARGRKAYRDTGAIPPRSLHRALLDKGRGSYTVLLIFLLPALAGAALSLIFAYYAGAFVIRI